MSHTAPARCSDSNFNESDYERIKQQRRQIEEDIIDCQNKAGSVINNWAFKLQYRDPEANFDRKKVKGRVFSLIQPKQHNFIKALEQGAGGKLRNIVVDNENTSKQLLQRRCFDNFEYLIPNSKIQYRELPRNAVENAKKIAAQMGGWALPAYEAINFNQELKPSIYFVFGSFVSPFQLIRSCESLTHSRAALKQPAYSSSSSSL